MLQHKKKIYTNFQSKN